MGRYGGHFLLQGGEFQRFGDHRRLMPRGASGIEMTMGSDILHDNSESYVNSVHARRIIMHCAHALNSMLSS